MVHKEVHDAFGLVVGTDLERSCVTSMQCLLVVGHSLEVIEEMAT